MKTKKVSVASIIKKLNVHDRKYKKRDVTNDGIDETWCNHFVNDVALALGCDVFQGKHDPLLANDMVELMSRDCHGWQPLDPDEAQAEANRGSFVVAGWSNKEGHGHVCVVIPGTITWSNQFKDDVPMGANVGTSNFYGKPVSYGFRRHMKPMYWMWIKPKTEEA